MAIREGRWDCTYCGSTGILGRHTTCTSCGRPRPEGVKFYLPEEETEVADQKLLNLANAGADWICQYCDSSNRASHTSCQHCGSPREEEMPSQAEIDYEEGEIPWEGDNAEPVPVEEPVVKKKFAWDKIGLSCLAMIGLALLLVCGVTLFAAFKTFDVELTVKEVSWARSIPVEAYRTVVEEDWAIPDGGRTLTTEQRIHHYDKVVDHYVNRTREVCEDVQVGTERYTCGKRDKGNGFFEDKQCTRPVYKETCRNESYRDPVYRDEPVHQTWYTYEIEKWVLDRTETASGHNHDAYWPEYTLADNERAGERTETYTIEFIDAEGKIYAKTFTYDEWLTYKAEGVYLAKVDIFGDVTAIESGP